MAIDTRARTDQILGQPPRLDPLPQDELSAEAMALVYRLREIVGIPREAPVLPLLTTLGRNTDFFVPYMEMGMLFMTASSLDPRDRELAILRTGWLCGAPYEWGEHVASAKRKGVSSEDIERVTQGSEAAGLSDGDRAILRAVEELHAEAMVSDATWAALARRLDEKQLIELLMLIGHYHKVAFVQNSLRLRPREGNAGLSSR